MASYEKSATKQEIRELFIRFCRHYRPKEIGNRLFTLPGKPGFLVPRSVEKVWRLIDPQTFIVGLEHGRDRKTWYEVSKLHRQNPGIVDKLYDINTGDYYSELGRSVAALDLAFEDRCGGATDEVRHNDWPWLFRPKALTDGACVAVTLNESPRIMGPNTTVVSATEARKEIMEICDRQGLKAVCLEDIRYRNEGKAQPMAFMAFKITHI